MMGLKSTATAVARGEATGSLEEYVGALEEERRKMEAFARELPLCLEIVANTIDKCKKQIGSEAFPNRLGCRRRQAAVEGLPFLEDFAPLKMVDLISWSKEREEISQHPKLHVKRSIDEEKEKKEEDDDGSERKSDWLKSAQLWNSPRNDEDENMLKVGAASLRLSCGERLSSIADTSSGSDGGGGGGGGERQGQLHRKSRRCWSPDLHRRFLKALEELGGPHVATPKQIREVMKIDGLTNDEVKSHLQKYRLHTRRPSPAKGGSGNHQPRHMVLGIWVPQSEYAAVAAAAVAAATSRPPENAAYSPTIASFPLETHHTQKLQQQEQQNKKGSSRSSENATVSDSSATSSSCRTTTTTASPCL